MVASRLNLPNSRFARALTDGEVGWAPPTKNQREHVKRILVGGAHPTESLRVFQRAATSPLRKWTVSNSGAMAKPPIILCVTYASIVGRRR